MKDTIYIDKEDEITAVIDAVTSSKEKVVALVLPKNAEVFQSVINMKLLKKAAKKAGKSVALISSDKGLEAAAAAAGLHMAATAKSKPVIPKVSREVSAPAVVEADEAAAAEGTTEAADEVPEKTDDALEIDNSKSTDKNGKKKKKSLLKIPDFSSFRLRVGLGVTALVLLIVGWVFAFVILPKATVTITADTRRVDVSGEFTAASDVNEFNAEENILPAELVEVVKEESATVPATGEKNIGDKATGSVTFTAQNCQSLTVPSDIQAGATVRSGGNEYVTAESASFSFDSFAGGCLNFSSGSTDITAAEGGTAYNLSNGSDFTVDGRSSVDGTGSASGGTDETAKVVSEEDITSATEQLAGTVTAAASEELQGKLRESGYQPLVQTIKEAESKTIRSAEVDAQVEEVTVTRTVTYSMLGITSEDLDTLLDELLRSGDEPLVGEDENIRDNGREAAVLQVVNSDNRARQQLRLQTVAVLGQTFDTDAIADQVKGKRLGEIESELGARDGVKEVTVDYSPLWVTTTPKAADKITVVVVESDD